jgi:hypothetical protein
MADTHDPIDHFRTTHPHAGEAFIDIFCWPGVLSIGLGVMSLVGSVASIAYQRHGWVLITAIVGVFAIAGGIAWLVVEHRRVLRIERLWHAENPVLRRRGRSHGADATAAPDPLTRASCCAVVPSPHAASLADPLDMARRHRPTPSGT